MTVVCGGGTSSKKAVSPAVVFLSGETLTALVVETLSLPQVWVSLLAFAAGQSIDLTSFCASDPPAVPTFSALEIAEIINPIGIVSSATLAKVGALVEIAAWYAFCQCDATTTPAPPAGPTYPPTAPTVNPPGFTVPGTTCWDKSWNTGPMGGFTFSADLWPPPPPGRATGTVGYSAAFGSGATFQFTYTNNADGNHLQNIQGNTTWFSVSGTTLRNDTTATMVPGATPITQTLVGPTNWDRVQMSVIPATGPSGTNSATMRAVVYCSGPGAGAPVTPCCPPDPALEARLVRMQALLELIFSSLPTTLNSYAESTVHSGLTGGGTITLVNAPLAVKVNITTDNTHLGVALGSPNYLFDRGYVVPIAAEGPIAGLTRLVYNPQLLVLPKLTEQIGYHLGPGVTASITELVRGP